MAPRRMREVGRYFEDFEVGAVYQHHWGRTLNEAESTLFANWTLNANPLYSNRVYARALGHEACPIHPLLVMNVVFGMSVEDLSEQALAHLGYWNMVFHRPVYPGQTLVAESKVLDKRRSESKPDRGVVHVRTLGRLVEHAESSERSETTGAFEGSVVLSYERKILVKTREAYGEERGRKGPPGLVSLEVGSERSTRAAGAS